MFNSRRFNKGNATLAIIAFLLWVGFVLTCIGAWGTHVVKCIQAESWGFLIAGAIAFPVGIVHGIMIWFGWA